MAHSAGMSPGLWPLDICDALVHSGIIHFHAQVICPGYEVAAPFHVLDRAFPRVQDGVLASKPPLWCSTTAFFYQQSQLMPPSDSCRLSKASP